MQHEPFDSIVADQWLVMVCMGVVLACLLPFLKSTVAISAPHDIRCDKLLLNLDPALLLAFQGPQQDAWLACSRLVLYQAL